MTAFIDSDPIRQSVLNLQSAGADNNLFAYLILRRLIVTNTDKDTGTITLTGRLCKPVTDEAALVGHGDGRYYNPLDDSGSFLTERWWSNGPTDNIKQWGGRSRLLERVQGTSMLTIRVADYDSNEVMSFLKIREDNRINEIDIAIWWFRNIDIEHLLSNGVLTRAILRKEFRDRLQLSNNECTDLFSSVPDNDEQLVIKTNTEMAIPRDYLNYPDDQLEDELIDNNPSDYESQDEPRRVLEDEPYNVIYFGAPGTGKSYELKMLAEGNEKEGVTGLFPKENVTRITFHPDYSYAQFVGCFKPYSDPKSNEISYKYFAGPFLKTYLAAITHPTNNYVLIIEELNRANPAAVFGDVFQLLDRNASGESEYAVSVPRDMADCIEEFFTEELSKEEKDSLDSYYDDLGFDGVLELSTSYLSIPGNMYIWATMNSADQGVFPMDTAFKRRWAFKYMPIDGKKGDAKIKEIENKYVPLGNKKQWVQWGSLRKGINGLLSREHVNEDKLIGPFFIPPAVLDNPDQFLKTFESKVLLYLFEDAAKTKKGIWAKGKDLTFSALIKDYAESGLAVFSGIENLQIGEDASSTGYDEKPAVVGEQQ